jgi:dipeptide transport system substrate-binding protein
VALNTQKPPMNDQRFREALRLAVDKSALIRGVYSGLATAATSFLPSEMWARDQSLADPHDLSRARELVKASGYDGRDLSLFVEATESRRGAESLQADWAAIGVKVKVVPLDVGELYKRTGVGDHDLAYLTWFSDNADPDNFLTPNLACSAVQGGGNKARWCDADFDKVIGEAARSLDPAKREALYKHAQHIVFDAVPVIPLVWPESTVVVDKRLQGFVPSPMYHFEFRNASLQ